MSELLKILALGLCLIAPALGQTSQKTLIADGSHSYDVESLYGTDASDVFKKIENLPVKAAGLPRPSAYSTYIKSAVSGNFYKKNFASRAYLYSVCDGAGECEAQGVILLSDDASTHKARALFNFAYPYRSDTAIVRVPDIDGDGIDELGLISQKQGIMTIRILEIEGSKLVPLGEREIYNIDADPPTRTKLFADAGKFYEEREIITAKGWTPSAAANIRLDTDSTAYASAHPKLSIGKYLIFATFVLQILAFLGLFGLVVYEFFVSGPEPAETDKVPDKTQKHKNGDAPLINPDKLPKLDPINCKACGAPVPLAEGEMTCPSCGVKAQAPAGYFDVAKARNAIRQKIREAAIYLRRARLLTSGWMRAFLALLVVWLIVSIVSIFVLSDRETFAPYQDLLFGGKGEILTVIGSFTTAFWIVSLGFAFLIWSPRVRKNLPKIEMGENIGTPETAQCPDCGGGISYRADDLATVCGYCGVEIYRAKLGWKLHDVTNQADEKAEFSLIDARNAAADAVDDVVGTPKVFMILLILMAVLLGVMWLLSSVYHMLPEPIQWIFDALGDIADIF